MRAKALAGLPEPFLVPNLPPPPPVEPLPLPDEPESFPQHLVEGESSQTAKPLLDVGTIIATFANSTSVQKASGRDMQSLERRFANKWTVENAIKDSVERFSAAQINPAQGDSHLDIANILLMQSDNASYHSVGRQHALSVPRPVDVQDLRQALGQGARGDVNGGWGTAAPSIASTSRTGTALGHGTPAGVDANGNSGAPGQNGAGHLRPQSPDVKEVLKDIFKEKKRSAGRKSGQLEVAQAEPAATAASA